MCVSDIQERDYKMMPTVNIVHNWSTNTTIREELDLKNLRIKMLPKNLTVEGNLFMNNCDKINNIPEGLVVQGDLVLTGTKIVSLPEDIFVKRYVHVPHALPLQLKHLKLNVGGFRVDDGKSVYPYMEALASILTKYRTEVRFERMRLNEAYAACMEELYENELGNFAVI